MGKICKWLSAVNKCRKLKKTKPVDFSNAYAVGKIAESIGLKFLKAQGLKLLEKNFTTRAGEIDLIMQDKDFRVFVEIRFRSNNKFGNGVASVNKEKQRKLQKTAQIYMQKHGLLNYRFDILSMKKSAIENKIIVDEWIKNAF